MSTTDVLMFQDWSAYNQHMMHHHKAEDEWVCNVCGKQLESTLGYRTHMPMHEEDMKKHVCPQCPIKVLYKSQLKRYVLSHDTTGHRLTCPSHHYTGKTFLNKDTLKRHLEIHKGEERYCTFEGCTKFSCVKHYLSDHI